MAVQPCLYPTCWKPECWVSHDASHICAKLRFSLNAAHVSFIIVCLLVKVKCTMYFVWYRDLQFQAGNLNVMFLEMSLGGQFIYDKKLYKNSLKLEIEISDVAFYRISSQNVGFPGANLPFFSYWQQVI